MTPAARLSAAIEILSDISARHRPVSEALSDWGKGHRFAGSGDRNAIGTLVFDCLRKRSSLAWRMDDETSRALVLAHCAFEAGDLDTVQRLFCGEKFAPPALTTPELAVLSSPRNLTDAPAHIRGDYPPWLESALERVYGAERVEEGAALALPHARRLICGSIRSKRTAPKCWQHYQWQALAFMPRLRCAFLPP